MKVDVREEQLLSLEFYGVRNADIAYVAPGRVERIACIIDS